MMDNEHDASAQGIDGILPCMNEKELALLDRHIPFGGNVLEFGCGGSSPHFLGQGVRALTSVESDKAWLETLVRNSLLRHFFLKQRWFPIHADIGATGEWGYPTSRMPRASWLRYHAASWEAMPDTAFDLILIDGRFRVACFCQSLLRCGNSDVKIIMHDFWNRPHYRIVLEFADAVDRAHSSVVLRPKPDLDWKKLCLALQEYQFNPA